MRVRVMRPGNEIAAFDGTRCLAKWWLSEPIQDRAERHCSPIQGHSVVPAGLLSSGFGFQSAEEHGLEACATLGEKL
jgi:hypothetical protein